ncbi:hypothetical protein OPV22_008145 [Ensete ventricosum]|uniref:RING-type domain-containing protein n=1 Tax=Ensete ventricosum TaxID=4639 RepID=A0AAV8RFV7_ENSVE|nr:hypothetical protein OPV22_008145 [Ensete ventricosum]
MGRPLHASSPLAAPGVAWLSFAIRLHVFFLVTLFVCCYFIVTVALYIAFGAAIGWCKRRAKRSSLMAFAATIPRAVYVVPSSSSPPPPPSPPSTSASAVVPQTGMESCIVCMEEFVSGEELWVLPRCKHWFHGECLRRWLLVPSMTCPVCRMLVMGVEVRLGRSHHNTNTGRLPFLVPIYLMLAIVTSLLVIIVVHT